MSLTYYYNDPIFSLADIPSLFDEALGTRRQHQHSSHKQGALAVHPKMDLHEDPKTNVVTATFEVPGLAKEAINIDIQNNRLTVSGENKKETEREENGYTVRERSYGKFSRTLPLPNGLKPEDVKASMKDGLLTITFPKTTAAQAPAKVAIA